MISKAINLGLYKRREISLPAERLKVCQELCSVELVIKVYSWQLTGNMVAEWLDDCYSVGYLTTLYQLLQSSTCTWK
jgi:hypothetical protein